MELWKAELEECDAVKGGRGRRNAMARWKGRKDQRYFGEWKGRMSVME